jgi:hypothetical protein
MKNQFSNYLILFFMLALSISQLPHVETSLLNTTLEYRSGQRSWLEAQKTCRSLFNHHHSGLAIIRTLTELTIVDHRCSLGTPCWIGLQRDKKDLKVWTWINNEAYDTIRWSEKQLNTELAMENCVTVIFDSISSSYLFDDIDCSKPNTS